MNPNEIDFEKELSSGPLIRKGFNDRLRRDIEQRIDREAKRRYSWKPVWGVAGTAALLAVVLMLPWQKMSGQTEIPSQAAPREEEQMNAAQEPPAPIRSALLIGLREEHVETDPNRVLADAHYSTYRTLLIAPVQDELRKAAEGSGILMPYGQAFWKIDSLSHKTPKDEYHYLVAHPADKKAKPEVFKDEPGEEMRHVETVLFAGNRYVSVSETEQLWRGNAPAQFERVWVKTLPQLAERRVLDFSANKGGSHVSLKEIFGAGTGDILAALFKRASGEAVSSAVTGENWTIERAPGRWVAKAAATYSDGNNRLEGYTLHEYPQALPDKVVSHDTLCCEWNEIKAVWPDATDALSSPANDFLVVFAGGKLLAYPNRKPFAGEPMLAISLKPGEKLVMAQWATGGYVQDWIDKARRYLKE